MQEQLENIVDELTKRKAECIEKLKGSLDGDVSPYLLENAHRIVKEIEKHKSAVYALQTYLFPVDDVQAVTRRK